MLPGKDGFEVCKKVRPKYVGPILMLTAKDEDIDQVVSDWKSVQMTMLPNPFNPGYY